MRGVGDTGEGQGSVRMHIGVWHMQKGVGRVKEDGEPVPLGVSPESWPNKTPQELATSVPEVRTSVLALDGTALTVLQSEVLAGASCPKSDGQ